MPKKHAPFNYSLKVKLFVGFYSSLYMFWSSILQALWVEIEQNLEEEYLTIMLLNQISF